MPLPHEIIADDDGKKAEESAEGKVQRLVVVNETVIRQKKNHPASSTTTLMKTAPRMTDFSLFAGKKEGRMPSSSSLLSSFGIAAASKTKTQEEEEEDYSSEQEEIDLEFQHYYPSSGQQPLCPKTTMSHHPQELTVADDYDNNDENNNNDDDDDILQTSTGPSQSLSSKEEKEKKKRKTIGLDYYDKHNDIVEAWGEDGPVHIIHNKEEEEQVVGSNNSITTNSQTTSLLRDLEEESTIEKQQQQQQQQLLDLGDNDEGGCDDDDDDDDDEFQWRYIDDEGDRLESGEGEEKNKDDDHHRLAAGTGMVVEDFQLEEDIFTFMFCYKIDSAQFWFGILVVLCVENAMILLLLVNSFNVNDKHNPLNVPVNVDPIVRTTQCLALVVAVFYEDDSRIGVGGLIDGRPSRIKGHPDFLGMTRGYWNFAHVIRVISGLFVLIASFLLIVQADNVFDVLLNFLGVSFASELSALAFILCSNGYFGHYFKRSANEIKEASFMRDEKQLDVCLSNAGLHGLKVIKKYMHMILLTLNLLVFLGAYGYLAYNQTTGGFIAQTVYVDFSDGIIPFLGIFNGCYHVTNELSSHRSIYKQAGYESGGGMFAYCSKVDGHPAWTFSAGTDRDPCQGWLVKSGVTKTFELYEAGKGNWYSQVNIPLDFLRISKISDPDSECRLGVATRLQSTCELMEPVGALSVMSYFRSDLYQKLEFDFEHEFEAGEYIDQALAHPIYIHTHEEDNHTVFDLILFTGRRWVLTDTDHINELHDASFQNRLNLKTVARFFHQSKNIHAIAETDQHWVDLISEDVPHATDKGTPLDLKWYLPEYHHELKYTFPSPKLLEEDVRFECVKCDNSTHPCRNGGFCAWDGVCQCINGATGAHCQDKPLGDGRCNLFFNKKSYDYDGGDCCGHTCRGTECGYDGLHSAFGKKLTVPGFGFEHCKDPELALVTVEWKQIQKQDYCNIGEEFCAIVAMNLRCDGTTYFNLPELRFDAAEDCIGPFNHEALVPYGSTCHLESSQDWYDVYYDFALYYGKEESKELIHEGTQDTTSVWFHIPSHCFSDALSEHVDSFFDDSVQAKVVETLSRDTISDRLCSNDENLLVERFALKVLNASVALDNTNIKAHQCQGWGGSAVKIECDEHHKITYLFIREPRIEGTIPTELALLSQLSHLDFFHTPLNGTIPVELSFLTNLEFLDLGTTNLTGFIPTELFQLKKLTKLDLHENKLSGTIHTQIGLLSNLRSLEIGSNEVYGTIPSELGLMSNLQELLLSQLSLGGSLPSEIGSLVELTKLVLKDLDLTGSIPSELQNLSKLISCDLGGNGFYDVGPAVPAVCSPSTA